MYKKYNQSLISDFVFINFFYSGKGYELLQKMKKDDFWDFYLVLKDNIMYNSKSHIFTDNVKNEIYKCLNLYRRENNDKEFAEDINKLISILNLSTSENSKCFYKSQLFLHFDRIFSIRNMVWYLKNVNEYEEEIKRTMAFDLYVVRDLVNENIKLWDFIKKWAFDSYPIVTINYLLNCYPEIFKQREIADKTMGLLLYDKVVINDKKTRENFKNIIDKDDTKFFGKTTSKILKQIKKNIK